MTNEDEEQTSSKESLKGVGQAFIGEIEIIGGILTGDPITQAEGEFNSEAGTLRIENSDALDETETVETEESNRNE